MIITILDQENNRVIVAEVPEYLTSQNKSSDDIAQAIFDALGLSSPEYMIGEFKALLDLNVINSNHVKGYIRLEDITQNFKEDALQALTAKS